MAKKTKNQTKHAMNTKVLSVDVSEEIYNWIESYKRLKGASKRFIIENAVKDFFIKEGFSNDKKQKN